MSLALPPILGPNQLTSKPWRPMTDAEWAELRI